MFLFIKLTSLGRPGQYLLRIHSGAAHEGQQLMGRTHTTSGEKCEEKGVAERSYYRPTTTPVPQPLHHLEAGEVEELGMKE